MNRMLFAAVCFVGGGLVAGLAGVTLAQDAEAERRLIEQQENERARDKARHEEEQKVRRALELAGKATSDRPSSDGVRVMESLNLDQIRERLKTLETELKDAKDAAKPDLAERIAKSVAEFQALLKRAEAGETVWRMAERSVEETEFGEVEDEELEFLLGRLEGRRGLPGAPGLWRERDHVTEFGGQYLHSPTVVMPAHADAFRIVENERLKMTFLIDTRTGETWWLESRPRGVDGFAWKRVEREMPEPRRMALPRERVFELFERRVAPMEEAERRVHELEKELEAARRRLEESRRGAENRSERGEEDKAPAEPSAPERRR